MAGASPVRLDAAERRVEAARVARDQCPPELGLAGEVVVKARGRERELARDVRVAEAVEAAHLDEALGTVEDARRRVPVSRRSSARHRIILPYALRVLTSYLLVSKNRTVNAGTGGIPMQQTEHKSFEIPEETREFPNGRAEILKIGGGEVGRLIFAARLALVERRQADRQHQELRGPPLPVPRQRPPRDPHGRRHRVHRRPGDITSLPSGHDAWVVGDEPVVVVDWYGASNYAKR